MKTNTVHHNSCIAIPYNHQDTPPLPVPPTNSSSPGSLVVLNILHILHLPHNPLEPLLLNLRLGRRNRGLRIRVLEATACLAVLELRRLGRAHALAGRLGAACRAAVCVGHAAARDELRAVAQADGLGARVVGGDDGGGEAGDCSVLETRKGRAEWDGTYERR